MKTTTLTENSNLVKEAFASIKEESSPLIKLVFGNVILLHTFSTKTEVKEWAKENGISTDSKNYRAIQRLMLRVAINYSMLAD